MRWAISSWILAIAMVGLSGATAFAGNGQVTLPDWMKDAAARPQKSYPARTNAVVLLDERAISVNRSGEYIETVRRVVRILRPEGGNEGTIGINVEHADALLSAHAWCSSSDGHSYEVKQKDFEQKGYGFGGTLFFMNEVNYAAELPAANPGAVVAFEYSVRNRAWGDYTTWWFQEEIPVEQARLTLGLPDKWNYKDSWVNSAHVASDSATPGMVAWVLHDVAALDNEEQHSPGILAMAGRMQLAFSPPEFAIPVFASWDSIGKWAEDLAQPRRQPSAEITAKVKQLTAGVSDFDGIVSRLAGFVQRDIRYVANEIGIGGWQPRAAGDTYRNHYGDCKDKATLLGSMLQVAGIHAENVLIFAEHGVTREDSPGNYFNHAILAIELPADAKVTYRSVVQTKSGQRYLIFDPTNEWVPVGELGEYEQGNFALLEGKNGGELIRMPVFPPEQNRLARNGKFTIGEGGGLSGELQISDSGSHAWRSRANVARENERERTRSAENFLTRSLQGATLKQATYEHLDEPSRELMVHYSFTASEFLKSSGTLLLFQPCVFGHKAIAIDWKKRKYPVDLQSTTDEVDRYEIALPAGMQVDDLPDAVQIDVGFASYKSSVTSANGVILYQREYVVRDPQVGLDKLGQLRKLEEAILRDEASSVVLKKI
jgi:transglutaminase-like putative cysteine protease